MSLLAHVKHGMPWWLFIDNVKKELTIGKTLIYLQPKQQNSSSKYQILNFELGYVDFNRLRRWTFKIITFSCSQQHSCVCGNVKRNPF